MAPPDDYGWAYIDPQRASASADGPETSVQFRYGADSLIPGKFSGSNDFTFQANDLTSQGGPGSGSVLTVTGALYVSGTIYADNYTIREITSTQIAHSGSTTFGNTSDDNHMMTGSLWVSREMSGSEALHVQSSSSFGDYMTFHHTITGAADAAGGNVTGDGDVHVNKAILNDLRVSGSSVKGANANTTHQITGSLEVSNTAVFAGAVQASQYIKHMGDLDTFIRFQADDINVQAGGVDFIKITEDDSQDTITFNEGGADVDFRVESDNGTHAIFVDAGNDVVHINQNEAAVTTQIHNDNDVAITVSATEVVINDDSHASIDFRAESDGEDEAIFLDSSANELYINKGETAFVTVIGNVNDVAMTVGAAGVVFNDDGHATNDLRIETDNLDHALFVDAGSDTIDISASLGPLTGSGEIHAAKLVANAMELSGTLSSVGRLDGGNGVISPAGTFTLSGSSHAVQIAGGLSASHDVSVEHLYTNDLYVSGTAHGITVDRANYASSSAGATPRTYSPTGFDTSGYLYVSGSTILGAVGATSHQVTGSFEVSGPAHFTDEVHAEAALHVDGFLTATGGATLGNASGDTHQVTGSFEVSGPAHFTSEVHAEGILNVDGLLTATGNAVLGNNSEDTHQITGSLEVSEAANFTSVVNAEGPLFVLGLLTATGKAILGNATDDTVQVTGSLEVSAPTWLNSNLYVPNGSAVLGDAASTHQVSGALLHGGDHLSSSGGLSIQSSASFGDAITFFNTISGSLNGGGGADVHADKVIINDLWLSGSSIIGVNANTTHQVTGSLEVSGPANFTSATAHEAGLTSTTISGSSTLSAHGAAHIGGTLTMDGAGIVFNVANSAGTVNLQVNDGAGADTAITLGKNGKVTKIGDDTPTDGQVLSWDALGGKVAWSDGTTPDMSGSDNHYTSTEFRTSGDLKVSGSSTLVGDVLIGEYLKHSGDPDTNIRFEADKLTLSAGAQEFIACTETTQNILTINPEGEDIDFKLMAGGGTGANGSIFMQGNDGTVHISGTLGPMTGSGELHCAKLVANDLATSGSTILGAEPGVGQEPTTHQVTGSFEVSGPATFTNKIYAENGVSATFVDVQTSIVHTGDTNTSIQFATDEMYFKAGNVEFLRFTETTQDAFVVNEASADIDFRVEGASQTGSIFVEALSDSVHLCGNAFTFNDDGVLRIHPDGNAPGKVKIHSRDTTATDAGELLFERYLTATAASGDNLGEIQFRGSEDEDGIYYTAASIVAEVDEASWTDGSSTSGRLLFYTTADGATTGTERMRIDDGGMVTLAGKLKMDGGTNQIVDGNDNTVFNFQSGTGYVGMGTETAPDTYMHVKSADYGINGGIKIESTDSTVDSSSTLLLLHNSGDSSITSSNYWVSFKAFNTIVGTISTEVAYNTFTGQHLTAIPSGSVQRKGMIVKSTGEVIYRDNGICNAWVRVEYTTTEKDKAVAGVYNALAIEASQSSIGEDMGGYNAIGEGQILVTDTGGNIEVGDYICSSNNLGHGMLQDDDLLHNYTVAKANEAIDFSTVDTDSELGFKSALVACTYHCG